MATELNADLEEYCSTGPAIPDSTMKRLYGFGLLPLVPTVSVDALLENVKQIAASPHLKGLIMGTKGLGKGLDDDALDPVWAAIEAAGLVIFLHPHYGVENSAFGEKENGHVLPLALGFPFETTIVCRSLCIPVSTHSPIGNYALDSLWRVRPFPQPTAFARSLWRRAPCALVTPCILH